jgi:hypothetical protein
MLAMFMPLIVEVIFTWDDDLVHVILGKIAFAWDVKSYLVQARA